MVLLQLLKQLIEKRMYIERHFSSKVLQQPVMWILKFFMFIHSRSFKKMSFVTEFINYRGNNYRLFDRFISFFQFIQEMQEYILNW